MARPADPPRVVVFAGPTLVPPVPLPPGFQLHPPARRGDVLAALAGEPHTLVLLDGYYYTVPAVTHKELLYALDAGVRVIGAASLGALRAVELAPWGMVGVGRVFASYCDGEIDGDDEVALLHAPAEHGYRPLTVALVEVREALRRLGPESLAAGGAAELVAALKALPFTDRSPARVQGLAREILGETGAAALGGEMSRRSVKREDALEALERAAREPCSTAPRRRSATGFLVAFLEAAVRCPPRVAEGPAGPTVLHAWNVAQVFHPEAAGFVRAQRRRSLLAAAAERAGLLPHPGSVEEEARCLRGRHVDLLGGPCLPAPEYAEEARLELLAGAARGAGEPESLAGLARHLGLAPGGEGLAQLESLVDQPDQLPAWALARAFSFTPAFAAAVAAAAAAEEVHRCFLHWSEGARVVRDDLWDLAASLWDCAPGDVAARGGERGLFAFYSLADGLRDALELVAAAERLPEPINDWPQRRDRLRESPLLGGAAPTCAARLSDLCDRRPAAGEPGSVGGAGS